VNGQQRPGARCDPGLDLGDIDVERLRINVNENRRLAGVGDGEDGGNVRVRDSDHLVASADAAGQQGQVQRLRPARDAQRIRRLAVGGELLFKSLHLRAQDEAPLGSTPAMAAATSSLLRSCCRVRFSAGIVMGVGADIVVVSTVTSRLGMANRYVIGSASA